MAFPRNYDPRGFMDPARIILGDGFTTDRDTLAHLGKHQNHDAKIFPEATNVTITLTAHASANTWSAWAEIADSGATTFSSKVTDHTHITGIMVENTSAVDKVWMLEISYGSAKVVVSRSRFIGGSAGVLPAIQSIFINSDQIPTGETVYYRLMSTQAGGTCQVHIVYHYF